MKYPPYPEGFKGEVEVVKSTGKTPFKTWLLRSITTGEVYYLSKDTVKDWSLPLFKDTLNPSIIVCPAGKSDKYVLALELESGEIYRADMPPGSFRF